MVEKKKDGMKREFARSPTLDTIKMIENEIAKHYSKNEEENGNISRTEIWKKLPKKVMWQTYLVVLKYLESRKVIENRGENRFGQIEYLGKAEDLEDFDEYTGGIIKILEKEAGKTGKTTPIIAQQAPLYIG